MLSELVIIWHVLISYSLCHVGKSISESLLFPFKNRDSIPLPRVWNQPLAQATPTSTFCFRNYVSKSFFHLVGQTISLQSSKTLANSKLMQVNPTLFRRLSEYINSHFGCYCSNSSSGKRTYTLLSKDLYSAWPLHHHFCWSWTSLSLPFSAQQTLDSNPPEMLTLL